MTPGKVEEMYIKDMKKEAKQGKIKTIQISEDSHCWLMNNRKDGSVADLIEKLIEKYRENVRLLKWTAPDGKTFTIHEDEVDQKIYNRDGTPQINEDGSPATLKDFLKHVGVNFEVVEKA